MRTKHPNAYAPDRATHVARMGAAARKNLYRPDAAGDAYQTREACQAWASAKVDAMSAAEKPAALAEIELAISKAFHGRSPLFLIRRLQGERALLTNQTEDAAECFADADFMETFGDDAWRAFCVNPPGPQRVAAMNTAVAEAKARATK